jgi:hypothetical protein
MQQELKLSLRHCRMIVRNGRQRLKLSQGERAASND